MKLLGQGLTCVRGGREIFAGLDLDVASGQALAVTGANGAGKSSLLRMIAGLLPLAGGAMLAAMFLQLAVATFDPAYGSGGAILGVGTVFAIGVGILMIGALLMLVWRFRAPEFFRGHTLRHDTPALIVAAATLPNQQVVGATLGTLAQAAAEGGLAADAPATLVIGEVAGLAMGGAMAAPQSFAIDWAQFGQLSEPGCVG